MISPGWELDTEFRGFSCKNVHVAEIENCDLSRKQCQNMEEETVRILDHPMRWKNAININVQV